MSDTNKILPLRFNEQSFRRYELIIARVVETFPAPFTFNPRTTYDLSTATFRCRFRDAIKSFDKYNWQPTIINKARFAEVKDQICVREHEAGELLTIGDKKVSLKSMLKEQAPLLAPTPLPTSQSNYIINFGDDPIARASALETICKLADWRLLAQAIRCQPVTAHDKVCLESIYDVSIDLDEASGIASIL